MISQATHIDAGVPYVMSKPTLVKRGHAQTSMASDAGSGHVLKLSLLGSPQIYIDDVRIDELERSNRRSQVLQLLALHRGSISSAQLAWFLNSSGRPYEDEALTAHYVRTLVWSVREQVRRKTGWDGIIESPTRSGAGLHLYKLPENTVCDLWEFESRLDEAEHCMVQGARALAESGEQRDTVEYAALLREEALQLYRGDFCAGSTNGCVAHAARVLEERYVHAALQQGDFWRSISFIARATSGPLLSRVAEKPTAYTVDIDLDWLEEGSSETFACSGAVGYPATRTIWREALRNYERVLKVDCYHEEANIFAMECYARLGNGRGLASVFTRYQEVLRRDLQQEPAPEVTRMYKLYWDHMR